MCALSSGGDESDTGECAEMVRGVRDALVDGVGDVLDASFTLGEQFDDLCSSAVGQGSGDRGETVEESVLGRTLPDRRLCGHYASCVRRTVVDIQRNV